MPLFYNYTHLWMYSGLYSAICGQFCIHFHTSTPTFICGRTVNFLFYTYTHLWMYSGFYSATATFSRPFSCTSTYIHTYTHRGPSLALFSRWQRVHGYTSLIRPRFHSSLHSLHSTSTLSEHFRDPSIINIFANSAFKKNYSFPLQTENVNFFVRILSSFPSVTFSRSFSVSWIVSVHFAHILINVYVHKSVLVTKTFSQTFMGPQQCNVLWVNILILSSF